MNTRYSLLVLALLYSFSGYSQLEVTNDQTVSYYIQEVFLGQGLSVSNITFNGSAADSLTTDQVGSFSSNGSYVDIESGIVMSTGAVAGEDFNGDPVLVGESTSIFVADPVGGDIDLEQTSGENINDQAVIEFDIVPEFGFLLYDYQFGSEEYPEYVNSFNDVFGFFLSGPGLSGEYSSPAGFPDGSVNIALVPVTEVPVSINNVNNGNFNCPGPAAGPCVNCDYYIDNCPIQEEALDGMTTSLMAVAEVQAGETYHIKLAIGDALDAAFDSAIFLMEQSLRTQAQDPTATPEFDVRNIQVANNPMTDLLILNDIPAEMETFELRDMQGRTAVSAVNITDPMMRADVSALDGGVYLLLLTDESGKTWVQRVVKE